MGNQRVLDYTGPTLAALAKTGWMDYLHRTTLGPPWTPGRTPLHRPAVRIPIPSAASTAHTAGSRARPIGRDSEAYDSMVRFAHLISTSGKNQEACAPHRSGFRGLALATVGELAASIAHEVTSL